MKRLFFALLTLALLLPLLVLANTHFALGAEDDTEGFNVFEILTVEEEETGQSEKLTEELVAEAEEAGTSAVGALILRAINILSLLVGTFAFVMILISGFMLATSGGDESQIDRGKAILRQAVFGVVVAFLAYFIVVFVQSFFF